MSSAGKKKEDFDKVCGSQTFLNVYELKAKRAGETRGLWESCFPEDGPSFLDYYYSEKTKDNRILAGEISGKIVSMLHRNAYDVCVKGQRMTLDYIVAVATRKEYRGNGYMQEVLTAALRDMNREGRAFTFLMPAAEAIYSPYDFRYISDSFNMSISPAGKDALVPVPVKAEGDDCARAAALMNEWLSPFDVHTWRDASYVYRLIQELASENGTLCYLMDGEHAAGLWAQWGIEKKEQRLLYIGGPYLEKTCQGPLMMGRITNIEAFLPLFGLLPLAPASEAEVILNIEDPWIDENNGQFLWTLHGKGSRLVRLTDVSGNVYVPGNDSTRATPAGTLTKLRAAQLKDSAGKEIFTLHTNISELTLWLFGRKRPKELWREQPAALLEVLNSVDTIHSVYLDEIV